MTLAHQLDLEYDEHSESFQLESVTAGLIRQLQTARGETVLTDRGHIAV
jgi:hypothetical protein